MELNFELNTKKARIESIKNKLLKKKERLEKKPKRRRGKRSRNSGLENQVLEDEEQRINFLKNQNYGDEEEESNLEMKKKIKKPIQNQRQNNFKNTGYYASEGDKSGQGGSGKNFKKDAKRNFKRRINEKVANVKKADEEFLTDFLNEDMTEEKILNTPLTDTRFDSEEVNLNKILIQSLDKKFIGHDFFTKIQLEIFKKIQERKHCLIRSKTGSGKTLAYLLPIYNYLLSIPNINRSSGISCIVMCPTRELSLQIYQQCKKLSSKCVYIVPGILVGGEKIQKEKEKIRKGYNIIIGTPSKLAYHLKNTRNFTLKLLNFLVVEECDLGFGLGQGKWIKEVLDVIQDYEVNDYDRKENVLKLFTTASYSKKVKEVLDQVINQRDFEVIGEVDLEKLQGEKGYSDIVIPEQLKQHYTVVPENHKNSFILCLLHQLQNKKVIIFVATADQANYLESLIAGTCHLLPRTRDTFEQKRYTEEDLEEKPLLNTNVFKLHGHIDHKKRKEVYNGFKDCKKGVLISTDVGARGLDFPGVKLIVLLDPPESLNHYSNKVGRTARLTASGSSLIVLHEVETKVLENLQENFDMKELDPRKFWYKYEEFIPKYYPLEDATIYLTHCIKKVKNIFI